MKVQPITATLAIVGWLDVFVCVALMNLPAAHNEAHDAILLELHGGGKRRSQSCWHFRSTLLNMLTCMQCCLAKPNQ
jgi:hypothetical protein